MQRSKNATKSLDIPDLDLISGFPLLAVDGEREEGVRDGDGKGYEGVRDVGNIY